MSLYKSWYVTKALAAAVQSANLSGNKVTFKYMVASRDKIDEKDYSGLTNDLLKTVKIDDKALVSSNDVTNNDATVVSVFTDRGVKEEHELNTFLLIAEYNGKEFLAGIMSANTPYLMPKENDNEHAEYTIRAVLTISNTAVVNVELNPEAIATNDSVNKVKNNVAAINKTLDEEVAKLNGGNEFKQDAIFDKNVSINGTLNATANQALRSDFSVSSQTANLAKKLALYELEDGADLNTLKEAGNYFCTSKKMVNSPVGNWFTLVIVQNGQWNGTQTLTDTNSGDTYIRTWNTGGKWFSSWEKTGRDSQIVHNTGDETIKGTKKFENTIDGTVENAKYSGQLRLIRVNEYYSADNLTDPGTYSCENGHLVGLPAYPIWGTLEVMNNLEGDVIQRFNVTNGMDAYVIQRIKNNNGWHPWRTIV